MRGDRDKKKKEKKKISNRKMMACVLVPLVLAVLLTGTSVSSSGTEQTSACPPRWSPFGQRCFAFFPVWSSWSNAKSMCSLTGGNLASLHTPEERLFVRQLASAHAPVWLGGHRRHQNGSWFWSDDSPVRISGWTNQSEGNTTEGGACMQLETKSGELHGAPCGELRFYICSTRYSVCVYSQWSPSPLQHRLPSKVAIGTMSSELQNKTSVKPGLVPGVSLFDVAWSYSDSVVEDILHSSSFLSELWSCHLTQRCYTNFRQQEALYLHRVSSMLEALLSSLQEADDVSSLLLETLKHYSSNRNQSLLTSPPPQWLQLSLQSFHTVVLEEPVYWLVALSARASLHSFLARVQPRSEHSTGTLLVTEVKPCSFNQEWSEESQMEVIFTQRYREVLEKYQDQMDVFKAINIFRQHMMNQKTFYKAVDCDVEDDK